MQDQAVNDELIEMPVMEGPAAPARTAAEAIPHKEATHEIHEERKLRRNLSRYLSVLVMCLCFYTFALDHIKSLNHMASSSSYVSSGLLLIFMGALVYLTMGSGYPLSVFGLTLKNWRRSMREGFLFSLPLMAGLLLVKWLMTLYVPGYEHVPVFDLHAGINEAITHTPMGNAVWWQTLVVYSLLLAPLQELISRGGLQAALSMFLTFKYRNVVAIVLTSMMFSTTHLAYPIHIVLLSFMGGLFWGWLFYRHKSLIGASISHIMIGLWVFWFLGFA